MQLKAKKRFQTIFDPEYSVVLGNGASIKNDRYMRGTVDDITIYHKVLSDNEISDLYNAPNPNRIRNILKEILKYGMVIFNWFL